LKIQLLRGSDASQYFDNLLPNNDEIFIKVASRLLADRAKTFVLIFAIGQVCVSAFPFITKEKIVPVKEAREGVTLTKKNR
jgi:HipA-like protein